MSPGVASSTFRRPFADGRLDCTYLESLIVGRFISFRRLKLPVHGASIRNVLSPQLALYGDERRERQGRDRFRDDGASARELRGHGTHQAEMG